MSPLTRNIIEVSNGGIAPWWVYLVFLAVLFSPVALGLLVARFWLGPHSNKKA